MQLTQKIDDKTKELAGIARLGLIGKNIDLDKELRVAKEQLKKQTEEYSALTGENKKLRTHVEKADAANEKGTGVTDRENKLRAELEKEKKNSSKWQAAFKGLVAIVNTLLVKMGKEPLPFFEDKPEATVEVMAKRNEDIR